MFKCIILFLIRFYQNKRHESLSNKKDKNCAFGKKLNKAKSNWANTKYLSEYSDINIHPDELVDEKIDRLINK